MRRKNWIWHKQKNERGDAETQSNEKNERADSDS